VHTRSAQGTSLAGCLRILIRQRWTPCHAAAVLQRRCRPLARVCPACRLPLAEKPYDRPLAPGRPDPWLCDGRRAGRLAGLACARLAAGRLCAVAQVRVPLGAAHGVADLAAQDLLLVAGVGAHLWQAMMAGASEQMPISKLSVA
jgi:hypothetical protein